MKEPKLKDLLDLKIEMRLHGMPWADISVEDLYKAFKEKLLEEGFAVQGGDQP